MWNSQVGGLLSGTTCCIFDGSPAGPKDTRTEGLPTPRGRPDASTPGSEAEVPDGGGGRGHDAPRPAGPEDTRTDGLPTPRRLPDG